MSDKDNQEGGGRQVARDEIRRACEAVGWEWDDYLECSVQPGPSRQLRFYHAAERDRSNADAHALLEATGEDFEIEGATFEGRRVYDCRVAGVYNPVRDTFREAAVLAVVAWAESKKSTVTE